MTAVAETQTVRATALAEVELLRREVEARLGRPGSDWPRSSVQSPTSTIGSAVAGGLTGPQIASLLPAADAGSTASGLRHRHHR